MKIEITNDVQVMKFVDLALGSVFYKSNPNNPLLKIAESNRSPNTYSLTANDFLTFPSNDECNLYKEVALQIKY